MEILVALKEMMLLSEEVRNRLQGGVWLNRVDQNDKRPNIMLQLMGGADGMTHQGPDGLNRNTVRIYFRADNDKDAALLAKAAARFLHGYSGLAAGISVQLCQRTQSTSDFHDEATVQRQIDSYVVSWRYS